MVALRLITKVTHVYFFLLIEQQIAKEFILNSHFDLTWYVHEIRLMVDIALILKWKSQNECTFML
jgi:hypothetical protein